MILALPGAAQPAVRPLQWNAVYFGFLISKYNAGITSIDSSGAVIMPPIIGAAMRRITSDPLPFPHIIGIKPAMMVATVITFGRTRMITDRKSVV